MRVALIQSNIIWEDKKANIDKIVTILEAMKLTGREVDIILLPEMSFTGFSMNTGYTAEDIEAEQTTMVRVCALCEKYHVAIGFGWVKSLGKATGSLMSENHYSVLDAEGRQVLDYAKLHPFSYSGEDKYFVGGDRVSAGSFRDFCIGAAICYDLRFPEVFQAMSDEADFIIVPANWPSGRREHFITLTRARAIENQCYIAAVNCQGDIGGVAYSGDSMVIAPDGTEVLPKESFFEGADKVLIYDLENNVADVRKAFPTRKDRRNDLYISFFKNIK